MKSIKPASLIVALALVGSAFGQSKREIASGAEHNDLLWKKLDARVGEMVERFDGVMGVAIVDLSDGRTIFKNEDRVFPTASSIKIAILLELYRQEQQSREGAEGKARLNDVYDFDPKALVDFSSIMQGLSPGWT